MESYISNSFGMVEAQQLIATNQLILLGGNAYFND